MFFQNKIDMISILIVSLLVLILIGFIISILHLYQKKQLRHAKELILLKSNFENETFRAQLEMQEETFQYISQEIHDNIGQFLSLAKLHLNTLSLDNKDLACEKINSSADLLTKALDDLRDLSRSLSSELIKNGGFDKAIEQQIMQLEKLGRYKIAYDIKGNYQYLDEQKEIILFRILQEAINNIVRHSYAYEVIVFLYCYDNTLKMLIQDNGRGFDLSVISKGQRKIVGGIANMKKRASMIKANIEIESSLGKGTKITISCPT
jgi:two-component system, NarL family, sensor kinase